MKIYINNYQFSYEFDNVNIDSSLEEHVNLMKRCNTNKKLREFLLIMHPNSMN